MKSFIYFYLSFILLVLSCNKPNDNLVEDIGPRTADDVISDFKNLNMVPGINDFTLESLNEGYYWNFRIIVPTDVSETNKKPMIFSLHGGAQNISQNAHKNTDCLITPGLENIIDSYIVSPNSNGALWYEQVNQVQILALFDLMTSNLPIDLNRTAITGYSDGGNGSWFYAQYYPSMFSAAIPMASSYNTAKNDGSIEKIDIPLYVIHGEDDQLFPIGITQGFVDASISAGSNIEFVTATGLDHYSVCDYVPYFRDAAQWLNTLWN